MARLPSRKQLADKIDKLERDLKIATAGAAGGAVLARSPSVRAKALMGARAVSPYALAVDALVREEESLLGRGAMSIAGSARSLAEGVERQMREDDMMFRTPPPLVVKKRPKSKFNKAISKGMSVVKKSTSFGKKNIINNPKKAFAAVTKTAASVKKTGKVAKSGIRRKIGLAIRKIL